MLLPDFVICLEQSHNISVQLDRRSKERYTMLAKERQNRILAIIRENNSIRMADIIKEFHVSHETARRIRIS